MVDAGKDQFAFDSTKFPSQPVEPRIKNLIPIATTFRDRRHQPRRKVWPTFFLFLRLYPEMFPAVSCLRNHSTIWAEVQTSDPQLFSFFLFFFFFFNQRAAQLIIVEQQSRDKPTIHTDKRNLHCFRIMTYWLRPFLGKTRLGASIGASRFNVMFQASLQHRALSSTTPYPRRRSFGN